MAASPAVLRSTCRAWRGLPVPMPGHAEEGERRCLTWRGAAHEELLSDGVLESACLWMGGREEGVERALQLLGRFVGLLGFRCLSRQENKGGCAFQSWLGSPSG